MNEASEYVKRTNTNAVIATIEAFSVEVGTLQTRMSAQDATIATQQATITRLESQVKALFSMSGNGATTWR